MSRTALEGEGVAIFVNDTYLRVNDYVLTSNTAR